jgi:hypothetical protein
MTSKQYEIFMEILRKAKKTGWITDHLNFIVCSKTINENAMDTRNLTWKDSVSTKKRKRKSKQQLRQTSMVSSTSSRPTTPTHTKTHRSRKSTKEQRV